MIIENPLSHVVVLRINDLSKYRFSPTVRIILRRDLNKIFIVEDHSSRVFEFEYNVCLEKLFRRIKKGGLHKHKILEILKSCYKKESKKFFNELINLGIIW
jgi:hypothetical protein